jgi:hypothetical protein
MELPPRLSWQPVNNVLLYHGKYLYATIKLHVLPNLFTPPSKGKECPILFLNRLLGNWTMYKQKFGVISLVVTWQQLSNALYSCTFEYEKYLYSIIKMQIFHFAYISFQQRKKCPVLLLKLVSLEKFIH